MKMLLVGIAVVGLFACNKSTGDTAPPASTGASVTASTAPPSAAASASAVTAPGSAACPLAQEIATRWCERRLTGCKESALTAAQCKAASLKYMIVGACKGTEADKKACLAAIAALSCESFSATGSNVPEACTTALK